LTGQCKPKHFECTPGECVPSPWVCDGEEVKYTHTHTHTHTHARARTRKKDATYI